MYIYALKRCAKILFNFFLPILIGVGVVYIFFTIIYYVLGKIMFAYIISGVSIIWIIFEIIFQVRKIENIRKIENKGKFLNKKLLLKDFIELNSHNLKKGFFWSSAILTSILLLYLAFFYSETSMKWIIILILLTLIIMPLFIIIIWSISWLKNRLHQIYVKSKYPFNKLDEIGFTKRQIITLHFNGMRDYYSYAVIQNWKIDFLTFSSDAKNVIFRISGIKEKNYDKNNKYKKFSINNHGVYKTINMRHIKSIQDMKNIIFELIEVAEKIDYKPPATAGL